MTGTSIVTQNVTTFIKNSANFEKYFLPGVVAFEDFRKASFLISASHTSVLFCPQLFIPKQYGSLDQPDADGHAGSRRHSSLQKKKNE